MKKQIIFPFDSDTLRVIEEIEAILDLPHRNCREMSKGELTEYINQLTLIAILK